MTQNSYKALDYSQEYLAHYGVKGMKWGVRKAVAKGNSKALGRHYEKAAKKLAKLNERADIEKQTAKAQKMNKIAKKAAKIGSIGVGAAVAGTGTDHTLRLITGLRKKLLRYDVDNINKQASRMNETFNNEFKYYADPKRRAEKGEAWFNRYLDDVEHRRGIAMERYDRQIDSKIADYNKTARRNRTIADIGRYTSYVGAGVGAAGLGTAAVAKGKAIAAKKRTTAKGHAKAVAKRNAWQKEMQETFKGTEYSALPDFGQVYYQNHKKRLDRRAEKIAKKSDRYWRQKYD